VIISHSKEFVFIKTRKTAGSSVQKVLWTFCDPKEDEATGDDFPGDPHVKGFVIKGTLGEEMWGKYYKFTIERNPWDKVVSLYWWVKVIYNMPDNFRDWCLKSGKNMLEGRISRDWYFNTDWGHYTNRGEVIVDFIMCYETLEYDFQELMSNRLGLPWDMNVQKLPMLKNQENPHHQYYTEYYDLETKALVAEVFSKEIEYFYYRFGK
jgi:hypothetical protein